MSISLSLLMLAAAQPNSEPVTFPDAFHGVWDWGARGCKASTSDSRISISASKISYWESDGKPVEIFSFDRRDINVTLSMSGEGETWQSKTRFVLSDNGQSLFAEGIPVKGADFFKTTWFYSRCSNGAKMGWGHSEDSGK